MISYVIFSFWITCNSYFLKWTVKPRANGRNIVSQKLRLQVAKSLACFKLCATTCNRLCKRTQHDIQQCWELLVNNVVVLKLRANGRVVVTLLCWNKPVLHVSFLVEIKDFVSGYPRCCLKDICSLILTFSLNWREYKFLSFLLLHFCRLLQLYKRKKERDK